MNSFILLFFIVFSTINCTEILVGPSSPQQQPTWLKNISDWKTNTLTKISYNGSNYDFPQVSWGRTSFIQPLVMIHDRYFYDPISQKYTVTKLLDDFNQRYGGVDSVLLWSTYPNIGIDNKNQFDLVRFLPGGIDGLKSMIADFHAQGVKVIFPYNPWDQYTNPEGRPDPVTLAELMKQIGADGYNGDTMTGIPAEFFEDSVKAGYPLVLQPEVGISEDFSTLSVNMMTFGYWPGWQNGIPEISAYKWLEHRHMVQICNRWATNHNPDFQNFWFSAVGFESWENVWGIWNGFSQRDSQALKILSKILRAFSTVYSPPKNWEPHVLGVDPKWETDIYASRFDGVSFLGSFDVTIYNLMNVKSSNINASFTVPFDSKSYDFVDLYHGMYLKTTGTSSTVEINIEGFGYGCLLVIPTGISNNNFKQFLSEMNVLTQKPLSSYPTDTKFLQQTPRIPNPIVSSDTTNMVFVSGTSGTWNFVVSGIEIEGGDINGVDVQYANFGENIPRRNHNLNVKINSFYLDTNLVTNDDYYNFLMKSRYTPRDPTNFLRHWGNSTKYPTGWEKKPVTWVSYDDSNAYCAFYKKRIPMEWEWQYAAQNGTNILYPWGNTWNSNNVPPSDNSRNPPPPSDIGRYPQGASRAGIQDLSGLVWQWTTIFDDEHTTRAIIRGGSYYRPTGSMWYFPQTKNLNEHGYYLMMSDSLDRAGMLGFRCASDIN